MKDRLISVKRNSQVNIFRLYDLRAQLIRELSGIKNKTPTAYIRIKREFGITGSRRSVLRQFGDIIEELKNG